jgi:hypothetical protein
MAVQFDGSKEMIEKYHIYDETYPSFGVYLFPPVSCGPLLRIGDYIVSDPERDLKVVAKEEFEKNYESADL